MSWAVATLGGAVVAAGALLWCWVTRRVARLQLLEQQARSQVYFDELDAAAAKRNVLVVQEVAHIESAIDLHRELAEREPVKALEQLEERTAEPWPPSIS